MQLWNKHFWNPASYLIHGLCVPPKIMEMYVYFSLEEKHCVVKFMVFAVTYQKSSNFFCVCVTITCTHLFLSFLEKWKC